MTAFKAFWKNYTNFTDRTTRRGYWIPWVIYMFIGFAFPLLMGFFTYVTAAGSGDGAPRGLGLLAISTIFVVLWNIAILVPSLAITIRRLRDAGIHWALVFIVLVPFAGIIAHIIMLCMPSRDTELNRDVPVV